MMNQTVVETTFSVLAVQTSTKVLGRGCGNGCLSLEQESDNRIKKDNSL